MKSTRKLQFFIFWKIFAPLEAKMMKNDFKKKKKWKHSRKIAIFHFLENFCTTGSKNDEKWFKKMIKKWKKNEENCNFSFFGKFLHHWKQKWWNMILKKKIKKWKKLGEHCNFPFFGKFLHHWKQKWWNMKKNEKMIKKNGKKMKKNARKIAIFHFLENFCTTGSKNDETWLKKWKND